MSELDRFQRFCSGFLGLELEPFQKEIVQRAVKHRQRLTGAYLEAFDRALEWAPMGTSAPASLTALRRKRGAAASQFGYAPAVTMSTWL